MIVQVLETIANDLGWTFSYGSGSWQNLNDYAYDADKEEQQVRSLLFFVDREKNFNEDGAELPEKEYSGELWVVVSSQLDDVSYDEKFKDRIFPLLAAETDKLAAALPCDWSWINWKMTEIHNELDANVDGWKIRFTVKKV